VLRLAHVPEAERPGDLYEAEGRLAAARRFVPRVAVGIGLVAVAALAVLQREAWVPEAGRLGQAALTQIDQAQRSRLLSRARQQALQEAAERLPHLSQATILLLTEGQADDALDPVELFRTSSDAADRGAAALTPQETQELKETLAELRKALRPSERERLRQYHAARVRRPLFPFEGADVIELFARGAYALPEPRLERLQELLGKAIAAGLRPPEAVAPAAETGAPR
jgi:hypothetical protein